jgi:hypothetical protein
VSGVLAAAAGGGALQPPVATAWLDAADALAPVAARLNDPRAVAQCGAIATRVRGVATPPPAGDALRRALDLALDCYEGARGAFAGRAALGRRGEPIRFADATAGAAGVVLAVVDGLLGVEPDAAGRRVRLTPRWPREWAHATIHHVRVGPATLEMEAVEGCLVDGVPHEGVTYRVRSVPSGALTLTLEHPVGARTFTRLRVDGADADAERRGAVERPHVRVTRWLAEPMELQFVGDRIG